MKHRCPLSGSNVHLFSRRFDREIQLGGVVKHRLLLVYVFFSFCALNESSVFHDKNASWFGGFSA